MEPSQHIHKEIEFYVFNDQKQSTLVKVPLDLVKKILSYTDFPTRYQCRLVNKNWHYLCSDILPRPSFRLRCFSTIKRLWKSYLEEDDDPIFENVMVAMTIVSLLKQ